MSVVTPPAGAIDVGRVGASRVRVDVWRVALDAPPGGTASRLLSDEETAFAARLRVGSGAWVAARAALRRVLGGCLELPPRSVPIEAGVTGKPRLAAGAGPDVRFNLAHSGGLALIAVRRGAEVGIDLEQLRPGVDGTAIAREVFTPAERAEMHALGGGESPDAFFRYWVRREALAKATGRGVGSPPAPGEGAGFSIRDLGAIPGFAAAVASEGSGWSVSLRSLPQPAGRALAALA